MSDKHPEGLGRSVLWSWSEVRDEVGPLQERVRQGETVYFEDPKLRVDRHGSLNDAYFTFSYSGVPGETGEVAGILISCMETTEQVRARGLQSERDRLFGELQVQRTCLE